MLRRVVLTFTFALLLLATPASALPTCQPGSMADFLALGADGCFLPRSDPFFRVSGFTYVGFDPEPVPATEVEVLVGPTSIAVAHRAAFIFHTSPGWDHLAFSFTIAGVNGIQIGRDVIAGTGPPSRVNVLIVPGGTISNGEEQRFIELPGVPEQRLEVSGFADEPFGIAVVGLSFSPTPEPTTLLLIGAGAAGLELARRVKRRRTHVRRDERGALCVFI